MHVWEDFKLCTLQKAFPIMCWLKKAKNWYVHSWCQTNMGTYFGIVTVYIALQRCVLSYHVKKQFILVGAGLSLHSLCSLL